MMNDIDKRDRILVIDDNRAIHEDYRKILFPGGDRNAALAEKEAALFDVPSPDTPQLRFEIGSAYQGQEGVDLLQEAAAEGRPYAMAFVDVRMPPGMDGIETAIKMWETDPDLQVVICTAYADYSWNAMIERLGRSDRWVILKKPFETVEVLQLANALTEKVRLLHQANVKEEELERRVQQRTAELVAANEAVRSETGFTESLLETAPAIVLALDTECRIVRFNRYMAEISGYTLDDVKGQDWIETFLPPRVKAATRELFGRAVADAPTVGNINPIVTRDGREREIEWYSTSLTDGNGRVIGVLSVGQDITERKRAEAREKKTEVLLRQSQKLAAVGTLARGMGHEINNPIMGVMNYAQLILDHVGEDSPVSEYAAEIGVESARVADIVHRVLEFAEQTEDYAALARPVDLVQGALAVLHDTLSEQHIAVAVNVPEDMPQIRCSSNRLQQVLVNLLTNAREALNEKCLKRDEDKTIRITAGVRGQGSEVRGQRSEVGSPPSTVHAPPSTLDSPPSTVHAPQPEGADYIRITVEDHGDGIAAEVRERMFDPFFSTRDRTQHAGLGLSTSMGIVKDHGGDIDVESEVGKGSRFHLDLPLAECGMPNADEPSEIGEVTP